MVVEKGCYRGFLGLSDSSWWDFKNNMIFRYAQLGNRVEFYSGKLNFINCQFYC